MLMSRPTSDWQQAARRVVAGAAMLATASGTTGASFTPAYADPANAAPAPVSVFTTAECKQIVGMLAGEVSRYSPFKGITDSKLTTAFIDSLIAFTQDDKNPACVGRLVPISGGDRAILNAMRVSINQGERYGDLPRGLREKFESIFPKEPKSANIGRRAASSSNDIR